MNNITFEKLYTKTLPEPCLLRKKSASLKLILQNDPFRDLCPKFPITTALKPTFHRSFNVDKSFYSPTVVEKKIVKNFDNEPFKLHASLLNGKNTINLRKFTNPTFTEKSSNKKINLANIKQIKSIFRVKPTKAVVPIPKTEKNTRSSVNQRVLRRVNSLVFKKDRKYRERSCLDFSFGSPD